MKRYDNRDKQCHWIPIAIVHDFGCDYYNGQKHHNYKYTAQGYRCELCHFKIRNNNAYEGAGYFYFCPKCGAKVIGRDDRLLNRKIEENLIMKGD